MAFHGASKGAEKGEEAAPSLALQWQARADLARKGGDCRSDCRFSGIEIHDSLRLVVGAAPFWAKAKKGRSPAAGLAWVKTRLLQGFFRNVSIRCGYRPDSAAKAVLLVYQKSVMPLMGLNMADILGLREHLPIHSYCEYHHRSAGAYLQLAAQKL